MPAGVGYGYGKKMLGYAVAGAKGGVQGLARGAMGGFAGGVTGAITAHEDQRAKGAIGGAAFGMVGGFGSLAYANFGRVATRRLVGSAARGLGKIAGHQRAPQMLIDNLSSMQRGIRKAGNAMHNANNRRTMMMSGAMLSGAFFGSMFAGNGKSYRRGFNANRGNGFGR